MEEPVESAQDLVALEATTEEDEMKSYGDWMFERRHGRMALRWDLHSWGVGINLGTHLDDWKIVNINECYRVVWITFSLGPFDLELAYYGPGRKWEEEKRVSLYELREGAIFETKKGGKKAMKTAYRTTDGRCVCYGLSNGRRVYFGIGEFELVRELSEEEWEG